MSKWIKNRVKGKRHPPSLLYFDRLNMTELWRGKKEKVLLALKKKPRFTNKNTDNEKYSFVINPCISGLQKYKSES